MAFTPRAGRAVISLGVDGAASSKKDIDSVGDSLKKVADSSFSKLSGQVSSIQSHIGGLKSTFADLAQLTVAGVGAGAFIGMIQGSIDAADNLNDLSKSTGVTLANLSGLKLAAQQSGGDLEGIADSINKLSVAMGKDAERFAKLGVTAKDPLEAFEQLADVFTAIEDPQTRAALGAAALGKSWASAAPLLSEGGEKIRQMVDRGSELSDMTQEMADRADEFNDTMAEMGTAVEGAKNKIAADMLPALTQITTAITDAYVESGLLSAALIGIGGAMAHAFTDEFSSAEVKLRNLKGELDVLKNYQLNAKESIPILGSMLWGSEAAWDFEIASKQKEIDNLLARPAAQRAAAQAKVAADRAAAEAKAATDKAAADKAAAFLKGEAAAKAEAAAALRQKEAYTALTSSIKGRVAETERELAGLAPLNEAEKMQIDLTERLLTGKLKLSPVQKAEYEGMLKRLGVNLKLVDAQNMVTKANEAAAKRDSEFYETLRKGTSSLDDQIKTLEHEIATYGIAESAVHQLSLAKLEAELAAGPASYAALIALDAQIEKTKALISLSGKKEALDVSKKMADEMISDSKRMADSIEHNLSDALMRGFESGKGFLENLRDTAKNMFKTLILQPTISGIMAPISGALAGAFMPSMAQAAAGSSGSSAVGSIAGGMLGAGGLSGSIAAGAGWLTGATTLGGSLTAGASLVGTGTLAGGLTGAGMIVGALAPIALGIAAAVAIWKKLDTSGTKHTGGASRATADGVYTVSAESLNFQGTVASKATEEMTAGLASGIVKILDSTATSFGKTAGYTAATAFADDTSKDGAWGALLIEKMGQQVVDWQDARTSRWAPKEFADGEAGKAQYLSALSGSVRTALDGIGLPEWARKMLDQLGGAPSLENMAKVVETINATQRALVTMGERMSGFANLSGEAANALLTAAGGIDALSNSASAYYDNFYSEGEKTAAVTAQIASALAAVGVSMPATRAEFRAQVDANLALGATAAPAVAVLLGVAGAFAQINPAAVEAAESLSGVQNTLADARNVLSDAYDREADAIKATTERMGAFATGLRGLRDTALLGSLSPLTPQQKYAEARTQYEKVLAGARAGDETAQGKYEAAYTAFLTASQLVNASGAAYQRDFAYAQAQTEEAIVWAEKQVDVSKASLTALQAQVSGLITINTSVLSVSEAINKLTAAMGVNGVGGTAQSGAIESLYQTLLGRQPEATGLQFWQGQLAKGVSITDISAAIGQSAEFAGRAAGAPAPSFAAINYSSMGNSAMAPLVAEIKSLRASNEAMLAEMKQLRADAREQSVAGIGANFDANGRAADKMVEATLAAARIAAQARESKVEPV